MFSAISCVMSVSCALAQSKLDQLKWISTLIAESVRKRYYLSHNVTMYRARFRFLRSTAARVGVFFIGKQNNWNILYRFFISFDLFGCAPAPFRQQFIYYAVCCYCCRLNQIPITCTNCDDITQSECECLYICSGSVHTAQLFDVSRLNGRIFHERNYAVCQMKPVERTSERTNDSHWYRYMHWMRIKCDGNQDFIVRDCVRLCILLFIGNGRTISLRFISSLRARFFCAAPRFLFAVTKRCIEIEIKSFGLCK